MPAAKKKAQDTDELDNMIIEGDIDDEDIDPSVLVSADDDDAKDDDDEDIAPIPEEGEDPLVAAKAADEEDEDAEPKEVPVGDGLDDEDGIEALKRAERELRAEMGLDDMIIGGEGAEEPEEE